MKIFLRFIILMKVYAVAKGRKVGIFNNWADCNQQIFKFPGAKFKSFLSYEEAVVFLKSNDVNSDFPEKKKQRLITQYLVRI